MRSRICTVGEFREWTRRMVATQYADKREEARDAHGFANVIAWNRDYQNRLRELEKDFEWCGDSGFSDVFSEVGK